MSKTNAWQRRYLRALDEGDVDELAREVAERLGEARGRRTFTGIDGRRVTVEPRALRLTAPCGADETHDSTEAVAESAARHLIRGGAT